MIQDQLEVKGLHVRYDRQTVLWDLSFSVPKGRCVGIIGPNGAGKSTLLKAMLGLLKPLSGYVDFFGNSFEEIRSKVAYVGQRSSVDWDFPITALEVVLMGLYGKMGLFRSPGKKAKREAMAVLERLGMADYAGRQISELSGGQQQRLFIARAIIQKADIYFLDEPFVCIDMATEKLLIELFQDLTQQGKTIFVVHHDLNTVEKYFDWLVMLNTRLVAAGPTAEVYTIANLTNTFGEKGRIFEEALKLTEKR